jgi:hypothetical protein
MGPMITAAGNSKKREKKVILATPGLLISYSIMFKLKKS